MKRFAEMCRMGTAFAAIRRSGETAKGQRLYRTATPLRLRDYELDALYVGLDAEMRKNLKKTVRDFLLFALAWAVVTTISFFTFYFVTRWAYDLTGHEFFGRLRDYAVWFSSSLYYIGLLLTTYYLSLCKLRGVQPLAVPGPCPRCLYELTQPQRDPSRRAGDDGQTHDLVRCPECGTEFVPAEDARDPATG